MIPSLDVGFGTLVCIVITFSSCFIFASYILPTFKKDPFEEKSVDDPKLKIDPSKKFAQNVKFAMRLKRRMKAFKARKEAELSEIN